MKNAAKKVAMDRDMQAAMWCMSLADGLLDSEEQRDFDIWCADPDNMKAFEDALKVWRAADQAASSPEMIRMRTAALDSFRRSNAQRWTQRLRPRWYWLGGVAAMLMVSLTVVLTLQDSTQVFETMSGERRTAVLEDGSRLSLDAETEVDVRFRSDRRELILVRGRAKFDVARNPLRPFSVRVGDKVVVATGTSFSVELLQGRAHVLLYEGQVAVLDARTERPVLQKPSHRGKDPGSDVGLTPGRELVVAVNATTSAAAVEPVNTARSLSWEGGQLSFQDEPLSAAVERVNRYSKRKIIIADASIDHMQVNGVFNAGDVDAFVEAVTTFNEIKVVRSDGAVTLRR